MTALDDLRAASLFGSLPEETLARIALIATPRELPHGHSVFTQGDAAEAFFLLAEGRVKVYKAFRDGRTATLRHVEPGDTFGESVLFHETYPSSAETMAPTRLLRFGTDDFLAVCVEYPEIAVDLLAAMARLLVLLNRRVEELLLPVPARLARYLLELADEQLEPAVAAPGDEGPRVVRLSTTKRELAARLGTVPETLSRTFDRLKRGEVLRLSGDHELIEILSFEKLRRLAQEE
ncbi:MAG: Crp/Fnr family transcriptional regulator [Thermoleophilia bacterium]|nr:Crp/Fnr family transcriptional regulator [Thermoleophilia bacterium]